MARYAEIVAAICILQACGYNRAPDPAVAGSSGTQSLCLVRGTYLVEVEFEYDARSGDTLIARVPISELYPAGSPPYVRGVEWFIQQEPLVFRNRRFVPYAPPRVIPPEFLEHVGEYRGFPIFSEKGTGEYAEDIYVPVRPGCEFQQYVLQAPY